MLRIFRCNLTKKEYMTRELEKELKSVSKGKMPKETRKFLAKRTIDRLDLNNTFQMHKSIRGYAMMLVENYKLKNAN